MTLEGGLFRWKDLEGQVRLEHRVPEGRGGGRSRRPPAPAKYFYIFLIKAIDKGEKL